MHVIGKNIKSKNAELSEEHNLNHNHHNHQRECKTWMTSLRSMSTSDSGGDRTAPSREAWAESGVSTGGVTSGVGVADEDRVARGRVGEMLEMCKGREGVHLEKVSEQSMFNKFQTESI